MIQQPDPRVVAKVAFQIAASPHNQQPRIYELVMNALIETCRQQGWSGEETFEFVKAYSDMIGVYWPHDARLH
jgi:hypothetical protein